MNKSSAILPLILAVQCAIAQTVTVSGRDDPVDVGGEGFDRYVPESSRIIRNFYYDAANEYLIYQLRTLHYQRCGVPRDVVEEWSRSDDPDRYFDRRVRDRYPCRRSDVPRD